MENSDAVHTLRLLCSMFQEPLEALLPFASQGTLLCAYAYAPTPFLNAYWGRPKLSKNPQPKNKNNKNLNP